MAGYKESNKSEINKKVKLLANKRDEVCGIKTEPQAKLRILRNDDRAFEILNEAAKLLLPIIRTVAMHQATSHNIYDKEEFIGNCISGQMIKGKENETRKTGLLYWFCAYDPKVSQFTSYLHNAINNLAVDHVRRFLSESNRKSSSENMQNFEPNFPANDDRRVVLSVIQEVIEKGPKAERNGKIFELKCKGHTAKEVGEIMGLPLSTVQMSIRQIYKNLSNNPELKTLQR